MDVISTILGDFWAGLSYLGSFNYWAAFLLAVFITVPIALLPGISATLVMAVMIPFIVISVDDPVVGIVMLATLTGIDNTLDSIPSILLGIPGGATQVTFLEGNQLAQRGQAAHTLGAVYAVSAIGGVVGAIALALIIPVIAPFVLAFQFAEKAAMAIFGVAMVAALSGGALIKGFVAALLGLLMSAIGPTGLDVRYAFGQEWLTFARLDLIAVSIGVFALPEIIDLTMTRKPLAPKDAKISYNEIFRGARYGFARWPVAIRQSIFGVFLGAVPGIGSGVVDWMSYAFGIFWTKDKSQFGKGSLDGVLFAESAQNSKEAGQAVPTLALGIPGGRAWAFIIIALAAYGIAPGPRMLAERGDITIMIVLSLGLGNLFVTMLGLLFTRQMARLTLIPYPVLGFLVVAVSILAAYLQLVNLSAITIVLAGAGLGMFMKRYKWPRPPMLIGFILGPIIETNLRDSVNLYGNWGETFTRPIFIILVVLALIVAALFTKFMSAPQAMEPLPGGAPPPAGGSGDEPSRFRMLAERLARAYRAWVAGLKHPRWVALGAALSAVTLLDLILASVFLEGPTVGHIGRLLIVAALTQYASSLRVPSDVSVQAGPRGVRSLRWRWNEDQWFSGLIIIALVYAIWEASRFSLIGETGELVRNVRLDALPLMGLLPETARSFQLLAFLPEIPIWQGGFSTSGRWFPATLAWIALPLVVVQFFREGLGSKTGEIMDIGIRSRGMAGARSAGLIFIVMLAAMLLIAGFFVEGLKWGSVFIATLGPMVMMQNRTGVIGGVISGAIILVLVMIFFDFLVALIWPPPFLLEWLQAREILWFRVPAI